MFAPLKHPDFRLLWIGMSLSYAGDRLQELAQGWLVATLTGSAMAVGGVGILSSIGMLLMPLGGVIADQADQRRILVLGQWCGALVTGGMAVLAFTDGISVWHIYLWAVISGLVWMIVRPAYKVIVTRAVPPGEIRLAVSLNSMTETGAIVTMNVGGSAMLGWLGLPLAFILNALSYLAAIFCLKRMHWSAKPAGREDHLVNFALLWMELRDGLSYLVRRKELFYPLLITFGGVLLSSPCLSLLAAIVKRQGGSLLQLGLLGASASLGALLGAVYAGAKPEGNPMRTYPLWGLGAAAFVCSFVARPLGVLGAFGLVGLGFLAFSQVVWNTSRIPALAESRYQARLQSFTSMVFTLGTPLGAAWSGVAVDRFGLPALLAGAGLLALGSLSLLIWHRAKVTK